MARGGDIGRMARAQRVARKGEFRCGALRACAGLPPGLVLTVGRRSSMWRLPRRVVGAGLRRTRTPVRAQLREPRDHTASEAVRRAESLDLMNSELTKVLNACASGAVEPSDRCSHCLLCLI